MTLSSTTVQTLDGTRKSYEFMYLKVGRMVPMCVHASAMHPARAPP